MIEAADASHRRPEDGICSRASSRIPDRPPVPTIVVLTPRCCSSRPLPGRRRRNREAPIGRTVTSSAQDGFSVQAGGSLDIEIDPALELEPAESGSPGHRGRGDR